MVQRIVHWYRGWFIGTGDGELVQKKVQAGRDEARTTEHGQHWIVK